MSKDPLDDLDAEATRLSQRPSTDFGFMPESQTTYNAKLNEPKTAVTEANTTIGQIEYGGNVGTLQSANDLRNDLSSDRAEILPVTAEASTYYAQTINVLTTAFKRFTETGQG